MGRRWIFTARYEISLHQILNYWGRGADPITLCQINGVVQISGTMQVGARYNFERAEVYWPQDSDSAGYAKIQDLVGDPEPTESGIVPEFQAAVTASADLDILVTPEVSLETIGVLLLSCQFQRFT